MSRHVCGLGGDTARRSHGLGLAASPTRPGPGQGGGSPRVIGTEPCPVEAGHVCAPEKDASPEPSEARPPPRQHLPSAFAKCKHGRNGCAWCPRGFTVGANLAPNAANGLVPPQLFGGAPSEPRTAPCAVSCSPGRRPWLPREALNGNFVCVLSWSM